MKKQVYEFDEIIRAAQLLKILGEPNRLLLLEKIIEGVQCNCELGDPLQLAPNLISHHLSVLRDAGFISAERDPIDSRWVYYSVNTDAFEEVVSLFTNFLSKDRIQPRRLTCGPQMNDEQRLSLLRMSK